MEVMVTPPERGTDMLTDLTPNGRAGWKTHALRLCNRHCAGSHCACMSPLLQRKMPWLQGSHLGITDAPLCFSVSCPSRHLLAKPAEGFRCQHGRVITLLFMLSKNGNCEKRTLHYAFTSPLLFLHSYIT